MENRHYNHSNNPYAEGMVFYSFTRGHIWSKYLKQRGIVLQIVSGTEPIETVLSWLDLIHKLQHNTDTK